MKRLLLLYMLLGCTFLLFAQRGTGYGRGSDYDVSGGSSPGLLTIIVIGLVVIIGIIGYIYVGLKKLRSASNKYHKKLENNEKLWSTIVSVSSIVSLCSFFGIFIAAINGLDVLCIILGIVFIISFFVMVFSA